MLFWGNSEYPVLTQKYIVIDTQLDHSLLQLATE